MKNALVISGLLFASVVALAQNTVRYSQATIGSHADYLSYVGQAYDFATKWNKAMSDKDDKTLYSLQDRGRLTPPEFINFLSQAIGDASNGCKISMRGNILSMNGKEYALTSSVESHTFKRGGTMDPFFLDDDNQLEFVTNQDFGDLASPGYLHINLWTLPSGAVQKINVTVIEPANSAQGEKAPYRSAFCNLSDSSANWFSSGTTKSNL